MDAVRNGTTPEHAKWVSYKDFARTYSELAKAYSLVTEDRSVNIYDAEKLKGPFDTVWPEQKKIFDLIYTDVIVLDELLKQPAPGPPVTGFDELLHPLIKESSTRHFTEGDHRNAVLDAITAVFDKIRERTGLDLDGDRLINAAMALEDPRLVLSELETESGRSDQKGFMELFRGLYKGVRNPKAHSLVHDLDAIKSAQYLVLASLLMRRVVGARVTNKSTSSAKSATEAHSS
jgi:uncharacterized protein (TIGR02391 family)